MSNCVNKTLHALNFDDIRRSDADESEPIEEQFEGRTTDEVKLLLCPFDRDDVAHVRRDGALKGVARRSLDDNNDHCQADLAPRQL